MRLSAQEYSLIFGIYLQRFRRRQFEWRIAHLVTGPGLVGVDANTALYRELSEAELRECINDVCEGLRDKFAFKGMSISNDLHNYLKDDLKRKIMGPTRRTW